jgi:serine/threonine protein kinase
MLVGYPPFFDEHPFRIYEKILEGKLEWPKSGVLDANAKDLIKKLLSRDVTSRLGTLKVYIIHEEREERGEILIQTPMGRKKVSMLVRCPY